MAFGQRRRSLHRAQTNDRDPAYYRAVGVHAHDRLPDARRVMLRVRRRPVRRFADLRDSAATDHRQWQTRLTSRLVTEDMTHSEATRGASDLAATLLQVTQALGREYGSPDLGNKADPVD